jgi:hypothetical protein
MNVKSYIGNLEIIGNGNVHVSAENPLNLIIGNELEMEFIFLPDTKDKNFRTTYKTEGKKWIWELFNFNNPLGTGVLKPIEVGTLNAKKLFVSFYSWKPNENSEVRIVNYVIYQEK